MSNEIVIMLKSLIKFILKVLFPRRHPVLVRKCQDYVLAFRSSPSEVHLAYWLLRNRIGGVMVDVGAHYGGSLRWFAEDGWQVYAFEPDKENRTVLSRNIEHLPNVHVDDRAVSETQQEDVPFFSSDVSSGISGMSQFHESHEESQRVATVPLSDYCGEKGITSIDFLKIDTEGFDLFVLKSVPWEKCKPRLIVCEFEDRKSVPLGYTFRDMADYLVSKGYFLVISEWFPVVEYGKQHKWRCFREYPSELADTARGHGNIIAVRDEETYAGLRQLCCAGGLLMKTHRLARDW